MKVLTPAVTAIVGVYFGAWLVGKREDTLLSKRVEREEVKERKADELELRTAARTIDSELHSMQLELEGAILSDAFVRLPERITSARFDAMEQTFARLAEDHMFQSVSFAYNFLDILHGSVGNDPPTTNKDQQLGETKVSLTVLWEARRALRAFAKPHDLDVLATTTAGQYVESVLVDRNKRAEANQPAGDVPDSDEPATPGAS